MDGKKWSSTRNNKKKEDNERKKKSKQRCKQNMFLPRQYLFEKANRPFLFLQKLGNSKVNANHAKTTLERLFPVKTCYHSEITILHFLVMLQIKVNFKLECLQLRRKST
jgi:hypothetical protein